MDYERLLQKKERIAAIRCHIPAAALDSYAMDNHPKPLADMVAELEEKRLDEYLGIFPKQAELPDAPQIQ